MKKSNPPNQSPSMPQSDIRETKVDWSTPYDEWLIPLLNRARWCGPIEFRAIPSAIQKGVEDYVQSQITNHSNAAVIAELEYLLSDTNVVTLRDYGGNDVKQLHFVDIPMVKDRLSKYKRGR